MGKSWTDRILWGLAATVLGMAVGICVLGGIRSQAADTWKAREAYYEQLEREYVGRVRQFLEERGYRSSGVTLSRIVDNDGRRSYRVLVHHGTLDRQGEEIQAEVLGEIENMGFFVPGCSFSAQMLR